MRRWFFIALLMGVAVVWAREGAQPQLPTVPLVVGAQAVVAEVADEPAEREAGLMFREVLGENEGMLFVMPSVGRAGFWMKNTLVPLSVAFIDARGVILEIRDMQPLDETVVMSRFLTVAYALEMRQGWFLDHGISAGERVVGLPPRS